MTVKNCLFNEEFIAKKAEDRIKLTPTLNDQEAFEQIIAAEHDTAPTGSHALIDAYGYFRDAIEQWLQAEETRAQQLYLTLTRMLTLVVIDLDSHDEAQVVFETLNARGQPLLQSDLIKNHLIHHAQKAGKNVEQLHVEHWSQFETDHKFWRKQVGRGHARRMIIEQFFFNYLTLLTRTEISAAKLYDAFKKHAESSKANKDPAPELASIAAHAKHYRRLIDGTDLLPAEMELRETMDALGFVALHPFMLGVLEQLSDSPDEREAIAKDLESWLIRRTICRLNTRGYNRFCVELVKFIPPEAGKHTGTQLVRNIRTHLQKQTSDSFRWPTDEELEQAFLDRPLYVELTQPRIRRVLSRIELEMRKESQGKSENFDVHQKFTIEHLMPRSWVAHWPLPDYDTTDENGAPMTDAEKKLKEIDLTRIRNRKLHTLGNLSLLTGKLNTSVSNSGWKDRRKAINDFSTLRLNQRVVALENWSEESIETRGKQLFKYASGIWPFPAIESKLAEDAAGEKNGIVEDAARAAESSQMEDACAFPNNPAAERPTDEAEVFLNSVRDELRSLACIARWNVGGKRSMTAEFHPISAALAERFGPEMVAQVWIDPPSDGRAVFKFEIADHISGLSREASTQLREKVVSSIRDYVILSKPPKGILPSSGSTAIRCEVPMDEPKRIAEILEFLDSTLLDWKTQRFEADF